MIFCTKSILSSINWSLMVLLSVGVLTLGTIGCKSEKKVPSLSSPLNAIGDGKNTSTAPKDPSSAEETQPVSSPAAQGLKATTQDPKATAPGSKATTQSPKAIDFIQPNDEIRFGVQYTKNPELAFNFTFSLHGSQLGAHEGATYIAVAFYNEDLTSRLTDWNVLHSSRTPVYMPGPYAATFEIDKMDEVLLLKQNLNTAKMVFNVDAPDEQELFTHYADLKPICADRPELFQNLDDHSLGCLFN